MSETRVAIAERIARWPEPDRMVYHLREGRVGDSWFQPVKCGGGITLNSGPVKVPVDDICPDCLSGRRTL